jgi:MoxR-like ATPase
MFTNVLNEAFLERFPITIEQEYPTASVEKKILIKVLESVGKPDEVFAEKLTAWADIIRKTFFEGGLDEIIATRRLVHICNAFAIFNGDRLKSIEMCVSRFDEDTKQSFLDLYTKVDADVSAYVETSDEESLLKAEDSSSEEEKEETYKPF